MFCLNSVFEFFFSKITSIYRTGSVKHFIFLVNEVSKQFDQMLSEHLVRSHYTRSTSLLNDQIGIFLKDLVSS